MADYSLYSDTDLANLLKSGDCSAFAEIYGRYKLILLHHAWMKTKDRDDARDTIQEVFAALWSKRDRINIESNLSGYLYTAVRNHILNMIERKGLESRYVSAIAHFADHGQVVTDHRVRENQLKALIQKEIAALPPRMREVFELSRNQHLNHKQIAALMGTSEQTVKKQMTNALKILRTKLGFGLYILVLIRYY